VLLKWRLGTPFDYKLWGLADQRNLVEASGPMEPEVLEAGGSEELGFFFKRLGEICFSPASSQQYTGPASSLAVAARCGAVFLSGSQGVCGRQHTRRPSRMPASLQQGAQRRLATRSLWVSLFRRLLCRRLCFQD
jgi:hypothetical protein